MQLILDKQAEINRWRKGSLFNMQCEENWVYTCRSMKHDLYLTPVTEINSKWNKDLNL